MAERWASFDCYGTLVDWRTGICRELGRLLGEERRDELLERYYELEPIAQRDGSLSYREVLARTLLLVAAEAGAAGRASSTTSSQPSSSGCRPSGSTGSANAQASDPTASSPTSHRCRRCSTSSSRRERQSSDRRGLRRGACPLPGSRHRRIRGQRR